MAPVAQPLLPRVWWNQVVGTVIDDELAIVFAAVLDGECPDRGVMRHPAAEELRRIIESCVALLLNQFRASGNRLLHELDDVRFGLKGLPCRIVAFSEVGTYVCSANSPDEEEIQRSGVEKIQGE